MRCNIIRYSDFPVATRTSLERPLVCFFSYRRKWAGLITADGQKCSVPCPVVCFFPVFFYNLIGLGRKCCLGVLESRMSFENDYVEDKLDSLGIQRK